MSDSYIMKNADHLTRINGNILVWHTQVDMQCVRTPDGKERLFIYGQYVQTDFPSQIAIMLCSLNNKKMIAKMNEMIGKK